jgi:hypothetical protein
MPRTLSPRAILEAQRQNSTDVFLVLISIWMNGVTENICVVNNSENIVSRGVTFIGCPFRITLPEDVDQIVTSTASIELDNVDPRIWQAIRLLTFSPWVSIEVIIASEPDNVILATAGMRLREATATTKVISATLVPDSIWQTGYPEGDFDPPQNPGLFA